MTNTDILKLLRKVKKKRNLTRAKLRLMLEKYPDPDNEIEHLLFNKQYLSISSEILWINGVYTPQDSDIIAISDKGIDYINDNQNGATKISILISFIMMIIALLDLLTK